MNPLLELRGKAGKVINGFLVPISGNSFCQFTLRGNRLLIESIQSGKLEKKRTIIRVKSIDAVELTEGRYWLLLIVGISLLFIFIGIIFIIAFFMMKQRSLVVYVNGLAWVLFYHPRDQELAENFATALLQVADQASARNSPT